MRFALEGATGEVLCFDGRLAAQATDVRPRGADGLLIARMFSTVGGQWVFQMLWRTWERGGVSWSHAWSYSARQDAQQDVARKLAAFPMLAPILFERLGWSARVPSPGHTTWSSSQQQRGAP